MYFTLFLISFLIAIIIVFITSHSEPKKDYDAILLSQIKKSNNLIVDNVFIEEHIPTKYSFSDQCRFCKTKNILFNKMNEIRIIMCSMINVYNIDKQIQTYYDDKSINLDKICFSIKDELKTSFSRIDQNDFELSQQDCLIFLDFNDRLNKFITDFIIGNAKFYNKIKFNNIKLTNKYGKKLSNKQIEKMFQKKMNSRKVCNFIKKTIYTIVVGVIIVLISNYLSRNIIGK